jgi:hypothetical protein
MPPWAAPLECQDGRDAAKVAEVTADNQGHFSATYVAHQFGADQVGYTFLAKVVVSILRPPSWSRTSPALPFRKDSAERTTWWHRMGEC